MEVSRKALKLARQAQDQRMVQLVRYPTAPGARSAERMVGSPQSLDPV
jgi:hypothetical protein